MLGARFKSSKYYQYSSGLNLAAALILNPIEGFETASKDFLEDRLPTCVLIPGKIQKSPAIVNADTAGHLYG